MCIYLCSWGNWASRTPVVYPIGQSHRYVSHIIADIRMVARGTPKTGYLMLLILFFHLLRIILVGSSDNDCNGLESSSGNSTLIDQQDAQRNAADASARNKHNIIVVIIIVLLLVGGAGGCASWILRKRRQRMQEIAAATVPVQFYRMCEEHTRGDIPQEGLGKAPAPGVWRVGAPPKQSMFGRDVEEPAFRKNIPVPFTRGLRPASGSLSRTPSAPPQLQRTRTTSSSVIHSTENPPPRYESWTLMMGRTATVGTTRSENDSEADVAFVEG